MSLKNMRAARNLSLAEFSRKLGIPLDMLVNGKPTEEQLRTQDSLVTLLNWCSKLSKTQLDDVRIPMAALFQLIRESGL